MLAHSDPFRDDRAPFIVERHIGPRGETVLTARAGSAVYRVCGMRPGAREEHRVSVAANFRAFLLHVRQERAWGMKRLQTAQVKKKR